MQVGQLHRVGDRLDLGIKASDVVVGDVGNLFEDELLDLLAVEPLDQQSGPKIEQECIAGTKGDLLE